MNQKADNPMLKAAIFDMVGLLIDSEHLWRQGEKSTFTGLRLGLASSSPPELIETITGKLGIGNYFSVMRSAVEEGRGKPDPAVYLSAADKLAVNPANCVAFEDSVPGVRSAKAAGMSVIAVPAEHPINEPGFNLADIKLRSLSDFSIDNEAPTY